MVKISRVPDLQLLTYQVTLQSVHKDEKKHTSVQHTFVFIIFVDFAYYIFVLFIKVIVHQNRILFEVNGYIL